MSCRRPIARPESLEEPAEASVTPTPTKNAKHNYECRDSQCEQKHGHANTETAMDDDEKHVQMTLEGMGVEPAAHASQLATETDGVQAPETVLKLLLMLQVMITAAQLVGAVVSNSLMMLGDAIHMVVDLVTYTVNYCAERNKTTCTLGQPLAALLSSCTLAGASIFIIYESVLRVTEDTSEENLNMSIVIGFTIFQIFVDIASVALFCIYKIDLHGHSHGGGQHDGCHGHDGCGTTHDNQGSTLNMASAFLHVMADMFRSIAMLTTVIVIEAGDTDPAMADAITAITISVVAICASVFVIYSACEYLRRT